MVIDPDEVAILGREQATTHWAIYDALSRRLQDGEEGLVVTLDSVLAEVSANIDCAACGRCCRHMGPQLGDADQTRLSAGLNLSLEAMREGLLQPMWPGASEGDQIWLLPDPCPLHDGLLCTVYEHRPQVCRAFPQTVGANPIERLQIWVESARVCPITFNTLERLVVLGQNPEGLRDL